MSHTQATSPSQVIPFSPRHELRQRRAAQALRERAAAINEASSVGKAPTFCPINIDGVDYYVLPHELLLLRAGRSPEDLALEPIDAH